MSTNTRTCSSTKSGQSRLLAKLEQLVQLYYLPNCSYHLLYCEWGGDYFNMPFDQWQMKKLESDSNLRVHFEHSKLH